MEMEFRSRAQAACKGSDTRHCNFRGIMSGDGTERRVASRLIYARESESRCSNYAVDAEPNRIEHPRTEGMCFAHREELPPRIVSGQLVVQLVGLSDGSAVKHVSSRECVPFRESVIDPGREIIFGCDLLSRKRIDTGVPRSQKTPIGQGKERIHKPQHASINRNGPAGQIPGPGCCGRNRVHLGHTQRLPQPFIVAENVGTVFPNGPARGRSKLIPAEERLRSIEKIPRIQRAISQKLENITMKMVRASPR